MYSEYYIIMVSVKKSSRWAFNTKIELFSILAKFLQHFRNAIILWNKSHQRKCTLEQEFINQARYNDQVKMRLIMFSTTI